MHWSYFWAGSIDKDGDQCPCLSIKVVEWICIPKKLSFRFVAAVSGVELIAVRLLALYAHWLSPWLHS